MRKLIDHAEDLSRKSGSVETDTAKKREEKKLV
jgi:hypothetical protein